MLFFQLINFIFGCTGPSLLCLGFLQLQRVGAALQLQCMGFSLLWLLLLLSTGSRCLGFSSCRMWPQQSWPAGSRGEWALGVVARGPYNVQASVVAAHRLNSGCHLLCIHTLMKLIQAYVSICMMYSKIQWVCSTSLQRFHIMVPVFMGHCFFHSCDLCG